MAKREWKLARVYKGMHEEFMKIAHLRASMGLDKRYNPVRVQKKMLRHQDWAKLKRDLEIAKFMDEGNE